MMSKFFKGNKPSSSGLQRQNAQRRRRGSPSQPGGSRSDQVGSRLASYSSSGLESSSDNADLYTRPEEARPVRRLPKAPVRGSRSRSLPQVPPRPVPSNNLIHQEWCERRGNISAAQAQAQAPSQAQAQARAQARAQAPNRPPLDDSAPVICHLLSDVIQILLDIKDELYAARQRCHCKCDCCVNRRCYADDDQGFRRYCHMTCRGDSDSDQQFDYIRYTATSRLHRRMVQKIRNARRYLNMFYQ